MLVYTDGNLLDDENGDWKKLAEAFNIRRVHSPERVCDQAALLLHRTVAKMSEPKRRHRSQQYHSQKPNRHTT